MVRVKSPYMSNRLLQFSTKSTNAENISQSQAHVSYNTNTLSKASQSVIDPRMKMTVIIKGRLGKILFMISGA